MTKEYNIIFKGYWRNENQENIPEVSGIYLVYKCIYNSETKTVKLNELMYIGQAENIRTRIVNHEKIKAFLAECKTGETLCYSIAEVKKEDLDIVENALIFAQQPNLNDVGKENYNHDAAEFRIEGKCSLMKHLDFTIR